MTMALPRFSIVTGANKGIGLAITKALAASPDATVVLAARNPELGRAAVESLSSSVAGRVVFHQLDVTSASSIAGLAEAVAADAFGAGTALDALVCNAGWAAKGSAFTADIARQSLAVNAWGVRDCSRALLPSLRASAGGGQLVVVSSTAGNLNNLATDAPQRARLAATDLGQAELDRLGESFVNAVVSGDLKGWPRSAYGVSKMVATAQVRLLAREEAAAGSRVCVSACCPGYVRTDMTSNKGHLTPEQGADTPVWLASGGAGARSGEMWSERQPMDFVNGW